MKKNNKSQLDEMQEQKLLKIEHNGCWLAFWGLLAVLAVQTFTGGEDMVKNTAGELIVFLCLCLYMLIACLRNGIWDRKFKPTMKTNLVFSVLGGMGMAIFYFIKSYVNYHKLAGSIATGIFMFISTFICCFVLFMATTAIYNKRKDKLEGPDDPEE
ncbi:DUF6773 family protein [Hespellia stercorisuis]|uniref:Uncharacterized protein n=1 Tax=Hespellia stercorisuis DSM 15480 TaxID=1121950 RepID=A0A1M6MFH3_9FIRM|nr:DUF6773 family protein [Hespellia stercorisuis]SHJ82214.1 hypothetical protein SAMN02745243_01466 [Hespellia stercorisuis DSM 15480]